MRRIRILTLAAAAAAVTVAGTAGTASAHVADVMTTTTGTCPANYANIAQLGNTTVCLHIYIPEFEVYDGGEAITCDPGWTEVSLFNQYGLCLKLDH